MDGTVDVPIPVETQVAAALADERKRRAIGRLVSRLLRPAGGFDPLVDAMERMSADARARGLTDEILAEELAAYNAERRG